jgi:hypothetical protein
MTDDTPLGGTTTQDRLEMHLAQALKRAELTTVRRHIEAALAECRALPHLHIHYEDIEDLFRENIYKPEV